MLGLFPSLPILQDSNGFQNPKKPSRKKDHHSLPSQKLKRPETALKRWNNDGFHVDSDELLDIDLISLPRTVWDPIVIRIGAVWFRISVLYD
ncbi:hypothetical protein NC652_024458 [Populus alba x Populus x berolinensis]|nr:hypothetical protein NC652_024458 [Populus alba x Populus x berolinensis]